MSEYFEPVSANEYAVALEAAEAEIKEKQFEMLRAQYGTPSQAVTASELASLVGYDHFLPVNSLYGRLGRLLAEELEQRPKKQSGKSKHWWSVLSAGESTNRGFVWKMHPQLAEALEELGWVEGEEQVLPEEISSSSTDSFREGMVREVRVNAYERSSSARRRCIEHYGCQCYVCGFEFEERYGEAGQGLIHVHHEEPLAKVGQEQKVDPIDDLKPVCPNCHAIIHRRDPPYSVSEVQAMLRD